MKKIDYIIISFVLIFILILYLFLYKPYINNTNDDTKIEIIVNNEYIDTISIIDINCIYEIKSDKNLIYIYKNDILLKSIDNEKNIIIYNKIQITNNSVKVIDSNCKGKDCMFMEINIHKKLPIICTNGVIIKIVKNNNDSDIII